MLRPWLLTTVLVAWSGPVVAMTLDVIRDSVVMEGPVEGHECGLLRQMLDQNRGVRRIVLRNSTGGHAATGYCVGELIRERRLETVIRGYCYSSCSRMWLGGVRRSLDGPASRVGFHGHYDRERRLRPDAPARLSAWLPLMAPRIDRTLMEQWIKLPRAPQLYVFYNDRAARCERRTCTPIPGRNARNAGLLD